MEEKHSVCRRMFCERRSAVIRICKNPKIDLLKILTATNPLINSKRVAYIENILS